MDERRDPTDAEHPEDLDDRAAAGEPSRRLGLAELAEAAGVSARTVRYYIAEGLLPPPEGAGPRSAYSSGHLDRLRLIGRLKDAYLPLREIRRRLDGLDDAAVRRLLARLGPPSARGQPAPPLAAAETPPDSAADYLARAMGGPSAGAPAAPRAPTRRSDRPPPAVALASGPPVEDRPAGSEQAEARMLASAFGRPLPDGPGASELERGASPARPPGPVAPPDRDLARALDLDPALALVPPDPETPPPPDDTPWRRIRLGPDAELLVREDVYRRRRDRVDWLIGWARKVFG